MSCKISNTCLLECPCRRLKKKLRSIVQTALYEKYGDNPDDRIIERVKEEWEAMKRCNVIAESALLYELTTWLKKNGCPYLLRSASGSSFILYLLGITKGNPLQPHHYCPKCKQVWWRSGKDGFDLSQSECCPRDGTPLLSDGHDIPWQILFGYNNSCYFEVWLPTELYEDFFSLYASHWFLKVKPTDEPYNSQGKKKSYKKIDFPNLGLMYGLSADKIPDISYSGNKEITSRLWNLMLEKWSVLFDRGNNPPFNINDIDYEIDGISDLISLYGLAHATGVWDEAAEYMIEGLGYPLSDLIVFRDDVYQYLIKHGFSAKDAWLVMDSSYKGKDLPILEDKIQNVRDKWSLFQYQKQQTLVYLFPKAHAVEDMLFRVMKLRDQPPEK